LEFDNVNLQRHKL